MIGSREIQRQRQIDGQRQKDRDIWRERERGGREGDRQTETDRQTDRDRQRKTRRFCRCPRGRQMKSKKWWWGGKREVKAFHGFVQDMHRSEGVRPNLTLFVDT